MPPSTKSIQTLALRSNLKLVEGQLRMRLVQARSGVNLVGERNTSTGFKPIKPTEQHESDCLRRIAGARDAALTVLSYYPALGLCDRALAEASQGRTIVGLAGAVDGTADSKHNVTMVASGGQVCRQLKTSLASEDVANGIVAGDRLYVYLPDGDLDQAPGPQDADDTAVRWAVLNCHEYTHVELLRELQDKRIELLVVVTHNMASRLYWQYAIADVHRLFCYVVIVNAAELGGSGVFAPFRKIGGDPKAAVNAGGEIFTAKGLAEFEIDLDLEIQELRRLRSQFAAAGYKVKGAQADEAGRFAAMLPSEHFMDTGDRPAGAPVVNAVKDVPLAWNATRPRVAVAQLDHMGFDAYLQTAYRLREHPACAVFESQLAARLEELEARCRRMGPTAAGTLLDFLVFPEVFIPRSFLPTLEAYSKRLGATIIAGIDYPNEIGGENRNECAILRPGQPAVTYTKLTRSQYDGLADLHGTRMPMTRGDTLWRFVDKQGRGFGVLICYDYSHFDLMTALNLEGRKEPLDLVFVVSHNPFSQLYQSCCIADAHRFYQHVVMCNVAEYGGSGIFTPLRTDGARQVVAQVGKGVDTFVIAELDLETARSGRRKEQALPSEGKIMRQPGVVKQRFDVAPAQWTAAASTAQAQVLAPTPDAAPVAGR